jgi:hypothetical protein
VCRYGGAPGGKATAGMSEFLGELGKKLAERWVTLLAIPGLLYLAAATLAVALGQSHALDVHELTGQIAKWAASPALKSTGGAILIIAAVLAGSVVAGLAAAAVGRLTEIVWTLPGRRGPARWLAEWRRRRFQAAKQIADDPNASEAQVRKAMATADRICLIEASRPTWIGDRLRACQARVKRTYGIDLNAAWPRLWLVAPEVVRQEISAARSAYSASARLVGWALLYLVLGIWWWPAAPIALIVGTAAIIKARLSTRDLADLIESAVDLHAADLAAQLGQAVTGPVTPGIGKKLTTRMSKTRWNPQSPMAD